MLRGTKALQALADFKKAKAAKNDSLAAVHRATLEANYNYFGYGFIKDKKELVPNVPLTFYAFRTMVTLGIYFIFFFILVWFLVKKNIFHKQKLLLWLAVLSIPLAYITSECGWIVAEVGRQPWVIQDIMPTFAAVSNIETSSVQTTFFIFVILFSVLLIAELSIMLRQIKKGPDDIH